MKMLLLILSQKLIQDHVAPLKPQLAVWHFFLWADLVNISCYCGLACFFYVDSNLNAKLS